MSLRAYYDVDTDGVVYHVGPSSESDFTVSSFRSETESQSSSTTIQSDEVSEYFTLHYGRQQPASKSVAKWYPTDNIHRHILRYVVTEALLGGRYVGPVQNVLAPIDGRVRQALEIGTRTGAWIQGVAAEFPHVQFRSLDVVPMIPHVPRQNIIFEVYDFTKGLMLEDESQDAVFLNLVLEVVRDYRALLREAYRVLRPGGLIYIHDFDPHIWDSENLSAPAHRTNPQGYRLFEVVRDQVSKLGIDPNTCEKLPRWLGSSSELWDKSQAGFDGICSNMWTFHPYPHDGHACMDQFGADVSSYVRHMTVTSLRDMSGLMRDAGMTGGEAEELIEKMVEELKRHDDGCAVFKLYVIYALKI